MLVWNRVAIGSRSAAAGNGSAANKANPSAKKGTVFGKAIVPCDGTQNPTAWNPALSSTPALPEQAASGLSCIPARTCHSPRLRTPMTRKPAAAHVKTQTESEDVRSGLSPATIARAFRDNLAYL